MLESILYIRYCAEGTNYKKPSVQREAQSTRVKRLQRKSHPQMRAKWTGPHSGHELAGKIEHNYTEKLLRDGIPRKGNIWSQETVRYGGKNMGLRVRQIWV